MILIGDALEQLRGLPSDHFDCVVTSPPYWSLWDRVAKDDGPRTPACPDTADLFA